MNFLVKGVMFPKMLGKLVLCDTGMLPICDFRKDALYLLAIALFV